MWLDLPEVEGLISSLREKIAILDQRQLNKYDKELQVRQKLQAELEDLLGVKHKLLLKRK